MRKDNDEFFVGYAPPMPPRLARFTRKAVAAIGALVLILAVALAEGHVRLWGGDFEFGRPTSFTGSIVERPYPALRIDAVGPAAESLALVVAPGKHGADSLVKGLAGRHLTLAGTRIRRDGRTMIELDPASLSAVVRNAAPAEPVELFQPAGASPVRLTGEVVDSKCFLGVMVPGSGTTHKQCASLCLRGGIPPALYVQDQAGRASLLLLTGPAGEPIGMPAVRAAGKTVTLTGSVQRHGEWLVVRTDASTWQRFE